MVMKAMLIGLLVIGAVAMMETDVSAACERCGPGGGYCCCYMPRDRERLREEVKKHGSKQLWIIGHTDDDPTSRETLKVQEMLIQDGLPPGIIGELLLEGPTPPMHKRKGQAVMVERTEKSHDHLPPYRPQ